jgi:demethylmenaquinone methyltransferase/2-methoxy-6-polyprenyl-1,4-benzoquinol methylase
MPDAKDTVSAAAWRAGIHAAPGTREGTRRSYDRMSRWYGLVEEPFERGPRAAGLRLLAVRPGERAIDIGCGPGGALIDLCRAVGPSGSVVGIDLSPRMVARATDRVRRAGLTDRVEVRVADAASLPWPDGAFDALFASFTLELFDTPEIPVVLAEWRRVLGPTGRVVVVALSRSEPVRPMTRAYEWLHDRFPASLDCRPIHAGLALESAGFRLAHRVLVPLFGLRAEAVLAVRDEPGRGGRLADARHPGAADDRQGPP